MSSVIKNRIKFILIAFFATAIGLYPLAYFFGGQNFGILSNKSANLLLNKIWNIAFYTHISLGGVALLIGWVQFNKKWRNKHLNSHRVIGKVYVLCVAISAIAATYLGFNAIGGFVSKMGFVCLAILWFYFTAVAYSTILKKQIASHKKAMIYSYSLCFAAVTLRIWLPVLGLVFTNFEIAYTITAWMCWLPNLMFAFWKTNRK